MSDSKTEWSITYKQIGVILISFVLGLIVALLISISQENAVSSFTTTELIGFVMSVILSGASIVLAISAIALGRSSEQAVINRSDESIRLQTELFTKTTDALQSIKQSTGVTEKRIEDIISGRAGDLSKQIAELTADETASGQIDVKELEEKIRKSLTQSFERKELSESEKEERMKRRAEAKAKREQYEKHHDSLLYSVANKPDVSIEKLGHGTPDVSKAPKDRYDGIFVKDGVRIAISTFMPQDSVHVFARGYSDILRALALPLEEQEIERLYLVQFDDGEARSEITVLEESLGLMKQEIASRIKLAKVPYSEIEEWVNGVEL